MYTSESDFSNIIKSSQPPIYEIPVTSVVDRYARPSNLARTSILRTNELDAHAMDSDHRHKTLVVPVPVVVPTRVPIGRARRTLTDDGSDDVVHHIGLLSPPPSFAMAPQHSSHVRATVSTSTTDYYELPRITPVPPPDFPDRNRTYVRQARAHSNTVLSNHDELIDAPLTASHQTLVKDKDYEPSLHRPVQVRRLHSPSPSIR